MSSENTAIITQDQVARLLLTACYNGKTVEHKDAFGDYCQRVATELGKLVGIQFVEIQTPEFSRPDMLEKQRYYSAVCGGMVSFEKLEDRIAISAVLINTALSYRVISVSEITSPEKFAARINREWLPGFWLIWQRAKDIRQRAEDNKALLAKMLEPYNLDGGTFRPNHYGASGSRAYYNNTAVGISNIRVEVCVEHNREDRGRPEGVSELSVSFGKVNLETFKQLVAVLIPEDSTNA
jgi:hypothetical protein